MTALNWVRSAAAAVRGPVPGVSRRRALDRAAGLLVGERRKQHRLGLRRTPALATRK